jgi:phytoene dehydrogenase-like protein
MDYDGILLGTGHNSLVLEAYLARAGLRCVSLDRAPVAGGGLTTVDNPRAPGFLHNTHAFFHRAATELPWFTDLELRAESWRYGRNLPRI